MVKKRDAMKRNARARSKTVKNKTNKNNFKKENNINRKHSKPLKSACVVTETSTVVLHLMDEAAVDLMNYSLDVQDGLVEPDALKDWVVNEINQFVQEKIDENKNNDESIEIVIEDPMQKVYEMFLHLPDSL